MIDRQRKLLDLIANEGPIAYLDLVYHDACDADAPTGIALDRLDTDLDYLEQTDLVAYDRISRDYCLTPKGAREL